MSKLSQHQIIRLRAPGSRSYAELLLGTDDVVVRTAEPPPARKSSPPAEQRQLLNPVEGMGIPFAERPEK
jgi:hypothetical protein